MDASLKAKLLREGKIHISATCDFIYSQILKLEPAIQRLEKAILRSASYQRDIDEQLLYEHTEEKKTLSAIEKSPYFVRCDIEFDKDKKKETIYFGKFSYKDRSIYSWVSPAAAMRFENPGTFKFESNNQEIVTGTLFRKDNFMIVDQKILFMASESENYPATLIYQEHFTKQKSSFILPEIVEQMEKAQDKIIRSHYFGSYLISGPAGSGKTTLALHRVAFLLQSPDTEKLFSPQKSIVFVQDKSTQNYFSKLLPDLGIHNVKVTTFDEWALQLLELKNIHFNQYYIEDQEVRDSYEHNKNKALQNIIGFTYEKDIFNLLYYIYREYLSPSELTLFLQQTKHKILDRFDLAALLKTRKQEKGMILHKAPSYKRMRNGKYKATLVDEPLKYSLIVIDEAENYLKENIELIKSCVDTKTQSIIYVGDLAQQTYTNTIKNWEDVNEVFTEDRKVVLTKVYRNTKQILEYISKQGYSVEVSNNLRDGDTVKEYRVKNKEEELEIILSNLSVKTSTIKAVLAKNNSYLEYFKDRLKEHKNVYVMSINEAQGVEFDTVFLVGQENIVPNTKERAKVNRDLLYVALTRAMNELHIFRR